MEHSKAERGADNIHKEEGPQRQIIEVRPHKDFYILKWPQSLARNGNDAPAITLHPLDDPPPSLLPAVRERLLTSKDAFL
jgi:hypothetical protein